MVVLMKSRAAAPRSENQSHFESLDWVLSLETKREKQSVGILILLGDERQGSTSIAAKLLVKKGISTSETTSTPAVKNQSASLKYRGLLLRTGFPLEP